MFPSSTPILFGKATPPPPPVPPAAALGPDQTDDILNSEEERGSSKNSLVTGADTDAIICSLFSPMANNFGPFAMWTEVWYDEQLCRFYCRLNFAVHSCLAHALSSCYALTMVLCAVDKTVTSHLLSSFSSSYQMSIILSSQLSCLGAAAGLCSLSRRMLVFKS